MTRETGGLVYELVNLEYLCFRWITSMSDDLLLKLPMLKAIQFACPASRCDKVFAKLHSQKRRLARKQLQIQFLGIALEENEFPFYDRDPRHKSHFNSKKQLHSSYAEAKFCNELDELNERNYKLYFTHSSRLAAIIPHVIRLQFRLVELNSNKRFFFRRFINVHEIVLNQYYRFRLRRIVYTRLNEHVATIKTFENKNTHKFQSLQSKGSKN